MALSLLGTKNWSICGVKFNFEILKIIENILIWRKITLKVNKYRVFTQKLLEKTKIKVSFYF